MFITMVNHASVFIEDNDIGILCDPWFLERYLMTRGVLVEAYRRKNNKYRT